MTTVVIMPGGFHPFHAGHLELYKSARRTFPDAEVYVAATNDTSTRPFPFALKEKLAKLAGVEPGHFVQVKSPFRAEEITSKYDPEKDVVIFVRSEKDEGKPPIPGGVKKDGTPQKLQPLLGAKKLEPFGQRVYMAYLPTVEFAGGMTSASEIRAEWPGLDEQGKLDRVMSLYPATQKNPKLAATVVKMLDTAINGVAEAGPFNYGAKQPRKGTIAHNAMMKRKEQEKNYKPTEPKDQMVGTAKVTKGVAEGRVIPGRFPIQQQQAAAAQREKDWDEHVKHQEAYEDQLKKLAAFWYFNDESPAIEKKLAKQGLEIGHDEGYDDGGVFIVAADDIHGDSYLSWSAEELGAVQENQGWAATLENVTRGYIQEQDPPKKKSPSRPKDAELVKTMQFIKQHYPNYSADPEMSVNKWVQRSLKHSEENDRKHDQDIARLNAKVDRLVDLIRQQKIQEQSDYIEEKWSDKYKRSIDCSNPKGFSQRAHCQGRKKK